MWRLWFLVSMTVIQMISAEQDYKKAIEAQLEKIEQAPQGKKAAYTEELASLYLKDQNQEYAFAAFLRALDLTHSISEPLPYDEKEYRRALAIYIDPLAKSPQATAKELLEIITPILSCRPEEHLFEYFMSIAYANLGKYEEFFHYFFSAYQFYPHHYLAYKTKAVLYIKILERTRGEDARASQRQMITDNLLLALQKEPLDTTIYRLLISFSTKEKKQSQVQLCLNKILNDNIIIPRSELMFYVTEAVEVGEAELAHRFIVRAREWYPQSRILMTAQHYLDTHK